METKIALREQKKRNSFSVIQSKYQETCLTCKIRKKRCSREHPLCADCKRLGKDCVWVNSTMTLHEIKELKAKVEDEEKKARLKRKLDSQLKNISIHKIQKVHSFGSKKNVNSNFEGFNLLEFSSVNDVNTIKEDSIISPQSTNDEPIQVKEDAQISTEVTLSEIVPSSIGISSSFNFFDDLGNLLEQHKMGFKSPEMEPFDTETWETRQLSSSNTNSTAVLGFSPLSLSPLLESFVNMPDVIPHLNVITLPSISKPLYPVSFPELNELDIQLYDYAINHILKEIGIVSDNQSSHYQKLYLPLASVNHGVFYALLSWAAYYKGERDELGKNYLQKSVEVMDSIIVKDENDRLEKLVNTMILMTGQICNGDVSKWFEFLKIGAGIIRANGGISSFNKNKQQVFLVSSFSYHDVLSTATCEKGTCFPLEDYEEFFLDEQNQDPDPLQGVSRPVFNVIGQVSNLAAESRRLLKDSGNINSRPNVSTLSNGNESGKPSKYSILMDIMSRASKLVDYIDNLQIGTNYSDTFTADELELQLTLFELFQYAAKLHLRLSVLKLNPSSLETQLVLCELLKSLNIVMKSKVEGSLCFPVFIAGINAISQTDRDLVSKMFDEGADRVHYKNWTRAKDVVMKAWKLNPDGIKCIDWYDIMKEMDWDLNFA